MQRQHIEFLWAWFDALRRGDAEAMIAALDPDVIWQGVNEDLVCHGPDEVIAAFISGYDATQEIDSVEVLAGTDRVVLGVRAPDLGEIGGVQIGHEIYNVFTITNEKITRIEDYLQRQACLSTGLPAGG